MTHVDARPATVWSPPTGVTTRGTVLLLPGRGEHPGVYERFGRRLAADGYEVRAFDDATLDTLTRPVVVAGSDTGALRALVLAVDGGVPVDGVLLAGVPAPAAPRVTLDRDLDWDAELDVRTACPVHQARLTADPAFDRGGLTDSVPPALADAVERLPFDRITVPVLILHGDADRVAPHADAVRLAARLPRAEFGTVHGGRHDVLNDATHRTVAAHIVQWLERLRSGATILTVEGP